jgi:hypothetical protein
MIVFISKLLVPIIYGAAETRLFYEHGEVTVMNRFRLYHVWLGVLFGLNAITDSLWTTLFLLFWHRLHWM